MDIRISSRDLEQGREVILATEGGRRHWAILRWTQDATSINGYVGTGAADGLDDVRPIRITSRLMTAENVADLATIGFIGGARLRIDRGTPDHAAALQGELENWNSFLAQRGESRRGPTARLSADDGLITMGDEDYFRLARAGFIRQVGKHAVPGLNLSIATAPPISGLRAAQMQAAVAQRLTSVPRPPRFDIKASKEALSAVLNPSSKAVMWYGTTDPEKARIRLQAAKSYPVLAGLIADSPYLARAVDAMEPIQDGLIERTGLGKGALKRISKLTVAPAAPANPFNAVIDEGEDALGVNRHRRFTVSGNVSLDMSLGRLADLPPDRVPQDDKSWQVYNDILTGCAIPLANAFEIPVEQVLGASKGDWITFHATLARAADVQPEEFDRRRITLATLDVLQAVEELSRTAIMPLILDSIRQEGQEVPPIAPEYVSAGMMAASRIIFGQSKNIAATAFEHARRYAGRIPALLEATSAEAQAAMLQNRMDRYGPENFPHLLKHDFHAGNGRVIRRFTNHPMMIEESRRLNHCVGHYYLDSAMKGTPLLSVQNADGSISYSTIELRTARSRNRDEVLASIRLVQHRGVNNSAPSEECRAAYDEFIDLLTRGALETDLDELEDWSDLIRERNRGGDVQTHRRLQVTWKSALGMDWESETSRAGAWEEWRYILGGRYGRADHPGILWSEKSCRDLLASMSPETSIILTERSRRPEPAQAEAEAGPSI